MVRPQFLLLAGSLASLLAATPALAADPFTVLFEGDTGVTGTMLFDFAPDASTVSTTDYLMNLKITNTTNKAAALTGFALSLPTSDGLSFLAYNPLSSPFSKVLPGGTTFAANTYTNIAGTGVNLPPLGSFDVCIITTGANCTGAGNGAGPLQPNNFADVSFRINSATAASTLAVSNLVSQFILANQSAPAPYAVATRWQGIAPDGGSDKVPGYICVQGNCTPPPSAPGDEVPGPLPLLGAAAAFGYSRKLRRRLNATTKVS